MKFLFAASVAALLFASASLSPLFAQNTSVPPPNPAACAPVNGWNFVCGARSAEDETLIPGTRWIIASGMRPGEGLKLVDTDAKTEQLFYTGASTQIRPDRTLYPHCPATLDPKTFVAHGIYLRRAQAPGLYNLYVVSHGALESIEVFGVDARGLVPSLTWTGCVPLPAGDTRSNAVAAFSDGTILVTLQDRPEYDHAVRRPGMTILEELRGEPTGAVLEWRPGADSFHVIPGTQLAGNNGIEISPDESEFYVEAYGVRTVYVFSRKDPSRPLRSTVAPGFTPDNLRWSGDRLLAAGPAYDEPGCGGTQLQAWAKPSAGRCNRGFVVAQLDPKAMTWSVVSYSEPNSEMGSVATGVIAGNTLWIGAVFAEGLAYRPLPVPVAAPPLTQASCAPVDGWNFVCGARSPEDEKLIPGTHWMISSGLRPGEGLKLVDTDAKTQQIFFTGAPVQIRPDKNLYPNCLAPPDPKTFNAHGIYLRPSRAPGRYSLYVVSHGDMESIEVFGVDAQGPQPTLVWTGCVPMPAGNKGGNSVAAFSDGTILVTVQDRPGTVHIQDLRGELTGDVLEWKPGTDSFHALPGARLAGDNGLEISPDESEFYVEAYGVHTVYVFSRKDPSKPLRSTEAPGFTPDNLRWTGDRLLAAGPVFDEPSCGGTPLQQAVNYPNIGRCNRGIVVAQLDPKAMIWSLVSYSEPNPQMGSIATGVIAGNTLWIGGVFMEGLAYRPLPGPMAPAQGEGR